MKTLAKLLRYAPIIVLTAMVAVPGGMAGQGPAPADIAGRWEGSINAGAQGTLRLAFVITLHGDSLSTQMYSPDQTAQAFATSGTTLTGSSLNIAVAELGGSFSGTLNEEGQFAGNWRQGGAVLPLVLTRADGEGGRALQQPDTAAPLRMKCPGSVGFALTR